MSAQVGSERTEDARTVRLLRRGETIECLAGADVVAAVREAIVASARGEAMAPESLSFDFRRQRGEAHIKGAYIEGSPDWTVKLATGFYDNPRRGLPTASGMSLVSSADTGVPEAIILDGGHLTDVRTAAAGCLAIDALAPERVVQIGVIGCGIQARIQLEYAVGRRRPNRVVAFGRNRDRAERFAAEMSERLGLEVLATGDAREAVAGAEVVVTATPSQVPLVEAAWLAPGATVVAVGADMPGKGELDPEILEGAEILVADDPVQASRIGELQHVPQALDRARALGDLLADPPGPRKGGVAVVDLTGLGAEDAAIAGLVAERARRLDLGDAIAID